MLPGKSAETALAHTSSSRVSPEEVETPNCYNVLIFSMAASKLGF